VVIVRHVKRTVRILFPSSYHLSWRAETSQATRVAGADGLVFYSQLLRLDLDVDTQTVAAEPVLSTPVEIHVPLTWIALLSPRLELSLAAGGGVDSYVEVVKFLLAGADVVATTSALLRHGPQYMTALIEGLQRWLADHAFESVSEIRGHLNGTRAEPIDALLRKQYAHSPGKHRPSLPRIYTPAVASQNTRRVNGARSRRGNSHRWY
jgi:dihydroorotate dehydrogenase (fumarate)